MITRFLSCSRYHLFDAPLIKVPPGIAGGGFLAALGGAYEYESPQLRSQVLDFAYDLKTSLTDAVLPSPSNIGRFLVSLDGVIEFLNTSTENSVSLYSYEGRPKMDALLECYEAGGSAKVWSLDELKKLGEKASKPLLKTLKEEANWGRLLCAIELLRSRFHDQKSARAIEKFMETCHKDLRLKVTILLAELPITTPESI